MINYVGFLKSNQIFINPTYEIIQDFVNPNIV